MADSVVLTVDSPARAAGFDRLMLAEQARIFRLCRHLLGDPDEADTATQDVFLKAYRALERGGEPVEDPPRWLARIAVNTCLDRLRSRRWRFWQRRARPDDEDRLLAAARSRCPSAEAEVFAAQIAARLERAIAGLSLRQRSIFVLKHYDDHTLEEIAGILQLEIGTVKAHLARALANLREELRDLYAPVAGALLLLIAVLLSLPAPGPQPSLASAEAQFYSDVYAVATSAEPQASAPIRGLFEVKRP